MFSDFFWGKKVFKEKLVKLAIIDASIFDTDGLVGFLKEVRSKPINSFVPIIFINPENSIQAAELIYFGAAEIFERPRAPRFAGYDLSARQTADALLECQ